MTTAAFEINWCCQTALTVFLSVCVWTSVCRRWASLSLVSSPCSSSLGLLRCRDRCGDRLIRRWCWSQPAGGAACPSGPHCVLSIQPSHISDSFWQVLWHLFIIRSAMFVRNASQQQGGFFYWKEAGLDRVNTVLNASLKPVDVRSPSFFSRCHSPFSCGGRISRRSSIRTSIWLIKGGAAPATCLRIFSLSCFGLLS